VPDALTECVILVLFCFSAISRTTSRVLSTLPTIYFWKANALLRFRSFFKFFQMSTILPIASATFWRLERRSRQPKCSENDILCAHNTRDADVCPHRCRRDRRHDRLYVYPRASPDLAVALSVANSNCCCQARHKDSGQCRTIPR
jgi:hypothetical protein